MNLEVIEGTTNGNKFHIVMTTVGLKMGVRFWQDTIHGQPPRAVIGFRLRLVGATEDQMLPSHLVQSVLPTVPWTNGGSRHKSLTGALALPPSLDWKSSAPKQIMDNIEHHQMMGWFFDYLKTTFAPMEHVLERDKFSEAMMSLLQETLLEQTNMYYENGPSAMVIPFPGKELPGKKATEAEVDCGLADPQEQPQEAPTEEGTPTSTGDGPEAPAQSQAAKEPPLDTVIGA